MMKDVELITYTYTTDSIGQQIKTPAYRFVFAEEIGVPRTEFFQAGQSGIKTAKAFQVRKYDYDKEEELRHGGATGETYHIYRVYPADNEMLELYCEVKLGG